MYQKAISYFITLLYRSFSDYSSEKLQQVGLNFGLLFFIVYIGKRPGCTPSELTKELHLDWGHSQRSLVKLVEDGFLTREKLGRSYRLRLTSQGEQAFMVCHRVFADWDAEALSGLTAPERQQLLALLQKAAKKKA